MFLFGVVIVVVEGLFNVMKIKLLYFSFNVSMDAFSI